MSGAVKDWFDARPLVGHALRAAIFVCVVVVTEIVKRFVPLPSWIYCTVAAILIIVGTYGTIQHMRSPVFEDESRDWSGAILVLIMGIVILLMEVAI